MHYAGTLTAMLEFEDAVPVTGASRTGRPHFTDGDSESNQVGATGGERWVLHGTAADAEGHMHLEKEVVGERLMNALRRHLKDLPEPSTVMGHRWKYAM